MNRNSEIRVIDFKTKATVRMLKDDDVDEQLSWEIEHGNVKAVYLSDGKIIYSTFESGNLCTVIPGNDAKKGNLGLFDITSDVAQSYNYDWEFIASQYAVNVGARKDSDTGFYICPLSGQKWEVVDEPVTNGRTVSISIGTETRTFHFERNWKGLEGQK